MPGERRPGDCRERRELCFELQQHYIRHCLFHQDRSFLVQRLLPRVRPSRYSGRSKLLHGFHIRGGRRWIWSWFVLSVQWCHPGLSIFSTWTDIHHGHSSSKLRACSILSNLDIASSQHKSYRLTSFGFSPFNHGFTLNLNFTPTLDLDITLNLEST